MRFPLPVGRGMERSSASSHEQSVLMFRNNLIEDGWKFEPSDEKLISKHLKPKTLGEYKGDKEVIGEIDLCKFDPCELPGLSKLKSDDQVWFFLCPRHFYKNSRRSKRRTKDGYWKPTGQVRSIKDTRTKRDIGTKKTLVFYEKASPKDLSTRWFIYEYEYLLEPNINIEREFVLIRLEKKAPKVKNQATSDVQKHATQSVQNQTTSEVQKHTTQSVQNQTTFDVQNHATQTVQNQTTLDAQNQATKNVLNQDNQYNYSKNAYPMASDSNDQNPTKSVALSTIENPHTNSNMLILEQSSMEGEAMFPEVCPKPPAEFTGDDMDILFLSEIQTPCDNNEVCCPRDSDPVYQPPCSHGESSSLKATDDENQNKDKNVNVSASQESEKNSSVAASLDSESQNASKSDLLVAGGNRRSPLMASLPENDAGGNVLTEEQWEAFLDDFFSNNDNMMY